MNNKLKQLELSKELLSEIVGFKVNSYELVEGVEIGAECRDSLYLNILGIELDGYGAYNVYEGTRVINIHELAHEYKEWALKNEFIIHSNPTQKLECTAIVQSFDFNKFYFGENQFYELSEPEAIFKACEWIYENKKGI